MDEQRELEARWAAFPPNRKDELLQRASVGTFAEFVAKYGQDAVLAKFRLRQGEIPPPWVDPADTPEGFGDALIGAAPGTPEDAANAAVARATMSKIREGVPAHVGSHSARELDAWSACPRRWCWLYPLGNRDKVPAGPAAQVGIKLHEQVADALRGGSGLWHPAVRAALAWLDKAYPRRESVEVEAWRDDGLLCGRVDLAFVDAMRYGQRVVIDWKFRDAGDDGLEAASAPGHQPTLYAQLWRADVVCLVQVATDGSEVEPEIVTVTPRARARMAAALLDILALDTIQPQLPAMACPGEPGYTPACTLYGDCPLRSDCLRAGRGNPMDARALWSRLSPLRQARVLRDAGFTTIDELIASVGDEAEAVACLEVHIAQEAAEPPPKPKRSKKAAPAADAIERERAEIAAALASTSADVHSKAPKSMQVVPDVHSKAPKSMQVAQPLEDSLDVVRSAWLAGEESVTVQLNPPDHARVLDARVLDAGAPFADFVPAPAPVVRVPPVPYTATPADERAVIHEEPAARDLEDRLDDSYSPAVAAEFAADLWARAAGATGATGAPAPAPNVIAGDAIIAALDAAADGLVAALSELDAAILAHPEATPEVLPDDLRERSRDVMWRDAVSSGDAARVLAVGRSQRRPVAHVVEVVVALGTAPLAVLLECRAWARGE